MTRKNNLIILLTGFIAVLFIFYFHFSFSILDFSHITWLLQWDWGTHFMGWHFYRFEPWHFPLGKIENYFYPLSTNLAYTDSIPLLGIFFKSINFLLPENFQYIGLWFFICYFLQMFFATLIVKQLKTTLIPSILIVLFFTFSPVLLARSAHPALNAHWLILASIWLFTLPFNQVTKKRIVLLQFLILILSIYIHPYLSLIVFAFLIQMLFNGYFISKILSLKQSFVYLVLAGLTIIVNMYLIGYIGTGENMTFHADGYGLFSMNLNAIFNPTYEFPASSLFDGFSTMGIYQSSEGFNYIGLGMIVLLAVALVLVVLYRNNIFSHITHHFWSLKSKWLYLLLLCALFAIFAISNIVTIGNQILFEYTLPPLYKSFCFAFRSSGRFFWPVYYILFTTVFYIIVKSFRTKATLLSFILGAALLLQIIDIRPQLNRWYFDESKSSTPAFSEDWKHLFKEFKTISFYPPFGRTYKTEDDYLGFCILAATTESKINIGYISRIDDFKRDKCLFQLEDKIKNNFIHDNELFVTTPRYFPMFKPLCDAGLLQFTYIDGYYALYSSKNKIVPLNGFNHEVPVVPTITDYLKQNEDKIMIFSIRDEGRNNLPQDFFAYLAEKGSKIYDLAYRGSYVLIIANKKIILEQISNDKQILIEKAAGETVNGLTITKALKIISAASQHGDRSMISVDGNDYSLNMRGMNMVVLDNNFTFIKKSNADTFDGPYMTTY